MDKHKKFYLHCLLVFVILLLSIFNLSTVFKKETVVLGESTEITNNKEFWVNFMKENPHYIPGWIELGEYDKVYEIDPNYIIP